MLTRLPKKALAIRLQYHTRYKQQLPFAVLLVQLAQLATACMWHGGQLASEPPSLCDEPDHNFLKVDMLWSRQGLLTVMLACKVLFLLHYVRPQRECVDGKKGDLKRPGDLARQVSETRPCQASALPSSRCRRSRTIQTQRQSGWSSPQKLPAQSRLCLNTDDQMQIKKPQSRCKPRTRTAAQLSPSHQPASCLGGTTHWT